MHFATVCQWCVHKGFFLDTVCIYTTVPLLLPRRSLIRFVQQQRPRPLFLAEPGPTASTAGEGARDARFATIYML